MKHLKVIQPEKCLIEDFEILAFDDEEQLNYYTVWHDNLIAYKNKVSTIVPNAVTKLTKHAVARGSSPRKRPSASSRRQATISSSSLAATTTTTTTTRLAGTTTSPIRQRREPTPVPLIESGLHQRQGAAPLPNGLALISTLQTMNKQFTTNYKLTKLYNKYRGQQLRRNYVNQKEKNARIESEVSKSYLNTWLAYTALQALQIPDTKTIAPTIMNNNTTKNNNNSNNLTTTNTTTTTPTSTPTTVSFKQPPKAATKQTLPAPPKQNKGWALFYIDPVNMITYSNRINPQQVADYKQKARQLPSNATSKKSSAASYDAVEVMEILANTNKTNVTITRNANRPTQPGSIYSHSVNPNTPGIVSTQLHLQARSYLDSMSKFYEEEKIRLQKEQEELENGPSHEDLINRYLKSY